MRCERCTLATSSTSSIALLLLLCNSPCSRSVRQPFITIRDDGRYDLRIPHPVWNTSGVDLQLVGHNARTVPFEKVHVADNATATLDSLQAALDAGLHLVLAPGIFSLAGSLTLSHHGQVFF